MTRMHNRRGDLEWSDPQLWAISIVTGLVLVVVLGVNASLRLAETWWPTGQTLTGNWLLLLVDLIRRQAKWTLGATGCAIGLLAVIVILTVAIILVVRRIGARRSRLDWLAVYMGWGEEITTLTRRHALKVATRLGVTTSGPPPRLDMAVVSPDGWGHAFGVGRAGSRLAVLTPAGPVAHTMVDSQGQWMAQWATTGWPSGRYTIMATQHVGSTWSFASPPHTITVTPTTPPPVGLPLTRGSTQAGGAVLRMGASR